MPIWLFRYAATRGPIDLFQTLFCRAKRRLVLNIKHFDGSVTGPRQYRQPYG